MRGRPSRACVPRFKVHIASCNAELYPLSLEATLLVLILNRELDTLKFELSETCR
jgi:hypothetical protein